MGTTCSSISPSHNLFRYFPISQLVPVFPAQFAMKLIFLVVFLLVATSDADGDTCQHWSVCNQQPLSNPTDPVVPVKRGKMGPKGERGEKGNAGETGANLSVELEGLEEKTTRLEKKNSNLEETITKVNEKLLLKIDLLEQEKDEMNSTIASQTKRMEELESLLLEQIERANFTETMLQKQAKQMEVYSKYTETLAECHLPDISLSPQTRMRVQHNTTIQLSCSRGSKSEGVAERNCWMGKLHPNFKSHPFSCDLFAAHWDEANKICTDLGSTLIYEGIDTTEKRKEVCRKFGVGGNLFTGITKT